MARYLLDTNCWMQLVRDRSQAGEVRALLGVVPLCDLFISVYSVHSIGTILARRGMLKGYASFLDRSSIDVGIDVIAIPAGQLNRVEEACLALGLDFDDAYQYVAAELNGLRLVSFDADFDRTPDGRLTPAQALQLFKDETK